jgi:hypothetical protein
MANEIMKLNLKHKNVFLNSLEGSKNDYETKKLDNINSFLEKESSNNKNESWNKMDKTGKIRLLNDYVDSLKEIHNLSSSDVEELKQYLTESLDKKKLQHVKDVQCDKLTGKIVAIPTLHFNTTGPRRFTLKRAEKRVSTLKSLGKGKKSASTQAQAPATASMLLA